jgi:acetyl esterase/lipase
VARLDDEVAADGTASGIGVAREVDDTTSTTGPPNTGSTSTGSTNPVPPPPGTCATLVYTPPTASAAHTGELCRPTDPVLDADGAETVVVLIHGGGGYSGSPDQTDVWRDEHLRAGRSTFTIAYTLLDPAAPATTYPVPEHNAKAAVQWIRSESGLVAPTIVLHGFSAGARLGGIVATTAGDPGDVGAELWPGVDDGVDGAILFYGYYDGMQFFESEYYGAVAPETASAIAAADAGDPDLLLVHGTVDVVTPTADSVALARALDAAGGSTELVLVDGADHAFDGYGQAALTPAGAALIPAIDTYLAGRG